MLRNLLILLVVVFLQACSSSSSSDSTSSGAPSVETGQGVTPAGNSPNDTAGGTTNEAGEMAGGSSNDNVTEPVEQTPNAPVLTTTSVTFNITVPVLVSDSLQVRVQWGEIDTVASWVVDETWILTEDFPVDTENQLVVSFNDGNGVVPLATFETPYETGSNATESFAISASQFNSGQFDSDNDGVSNLAESVAGTNPGRLDTAEPVQASLNVAEDKTFRLTWQASERAQFYRVLENPDGISGFVQISDDLGAAVQTFDHRVALYARVNAQYIVQACNSVGCVDSDVQMVSGSLENAITYIKASNTGQNDSFGIVALSADGNTLVVGARQESSSAIGINGEQNENSFRNRGAAYVFARIETADGTGRVWQQQAYLKPSNRTGSAVTVSGSSFGASVSLSADGNTLVVGASSEGGGSTGVNGDQTDHTQEFSGAAYVFVRDNSTWEQQAYVKASNTGAFDSFGHAVSLSASGDTLAVSAIREDSTAIGTDVRQDNNASEGAGAVYIYVRNNSSWQQQAFVKAEVSGEGALFGNSLSLSSDGQTLAVGSNPNSGSGFVYIYVLNNGSWQQQALLNASNADSIDGFGSSVSLSSDGNTLAVGAAREDGNATGVNGDQTTNGFIDSGAAYVFLRSNQSWQQQAYLKASNTGVGDRFGGTITLSGDGNTLAVAAAGEDSTASGLNGDSTDNAGNTNGAVYVFKQSDSNWQQQAYLKASNSGIIDGFGGGIALSSDGQTLAVGAVLEDGAATGINGDQTIATPVTLDSGAVYLY